MDSTIVCSPNQLLSPNPTQATSKCHRFTVHSVTQCFPSPALSCIVNAQQHAQISRVLVTDSESSKISQSEPSASSSLRDVHISARLMEDFLHVAKGNTDKDLETCGVLGASFERGIFFVTTLIIPKQESTSSSCQAMNENEVFAIQSDRSLCPVGWIHTHPSQTCFMSSIDLHTQYSYQVMVPEAFAIVIAPRDKSRENGIFRISDMGMNVLKECKESGFHPHKELADGSPIYEHCSHVCTNSNLRFEIFDLR